MVYASQHVTYEVVECVEAEVEDGVMRSRPSSVLHAEGRRLDCYHCTR